MHVKPTANIIMVKSISSKIRNETKMSTLDSFNQHSLEVLAMAIREEKEIKGMQTGKEDVKWSPFVDAMILYIENPKDATRKLVELINGFCKVAGYKFNTQKFVVYLYINNKRSEREVYLSKKTKDLYSDNY